MFDPTKPANNSANSSAEMRSQLNGLKDLIDAVPTITSAQVDAVDTLPPGDPASVTASMSGTVLHLTFGIPQGADGPTGANGSNGSDGAQGPQGPQGEQGVPGEVTLAQLTTAINTTALNPNGVGPISGSFSDPVSAGDLNVVKDKVNELIAALFRAP